MQTGEPAQPVQFSFVTASKGGFFFRGVFKPSDHGHDLFNPRSIGVFGSAGGFGFGFAAAAGGGAAAVSGFGAAVGWSAISS